MGAQGIRTLIIGLKGRCSAVELCPKSISVPCERRAATPHVGHLRGASKRSKAPSVPVQWRGPEEVHYSKIVTTALISPRGLSHLQIRRFLECRVPRESDGGRP